MAAKMQHFDPPSSASSESDDTEVCLDDKEILFADELCEDAERCRRSDIGTPTPQSPRPPSTGSQRSPRSRRQRTTSLSQSSKKTSAESILRSKTRTIYTAGRPPWYNSAGQQVEPFVIGICGGSASGKTTVATKIIESLDVPWVTLLSMDSFYKVLNEKQHDMAARNEYNFDHPDAFDFELLKTTLQRLKEGRMVEVPIYNFVTHRRESRTKTMYGANVIIFEGILTFYNVDVLKRGFKLREKLAHSYIGQPLPSSLYLLPDTPQIKGLHTFIRNKETYRDEFIFYSKRLIRLVIEYALSLLPFEDVRVETPQGVLYHGKRAATDKICGVSILRAGETMEQAVRDVCKDIRIGKILIQTNQQTGEPELYYLRLPKDIKDYKVILMDATVATGAAAIMAIRVLLDHDVAEENVLLVSLLMAESGVHSIAYAFPRVKIVTSALDPVINEKFYVLPGIGNFGDRYFGTEPSTIED
ncbi:uridine-cytidine kinase-like 1 isoform X2 [Bombus pyrosoma]|uniref:uridine-cytidine kinase-like 1 isoform X2 n=1 Tax=Bombus pyrosoma TaxID=396416 RepID=UPI001CB9649F|nr:uridine-cytidine kinase-like 1 isoform X2 [Bombus pyrosoma]